jgi:hypothetical protein
LRNKSEKEILRSIETMKKHPFFSRTSLLRIDGERALANTRIQREILDKYGLKVLASSNYKCEKAENQIRKWRIVLGKGS